MHFNIEEKMILEMYRGKTKIEALNNIKNSFPYIKEETRQIVENLINQLEQMSEEEYKKIDQENAELPIDIADFIEA